MQDLEEKFRDHTERFLKFNTVAKLYFNLVDLPLREANRILNIINGDSSSD